MHGVVDEDAALWRAFEDNEITHSGAHYLLAIDALTRDRGTPPRAADVARRLGVSRAAVSSQLRVLREQGLVEPQGRYLLALSARGRQLVRRIATKRHVVEYFLAKILGVDEEVAKEDACKVEHLLSEQSARALLDLVLLARNQHPTVADLSRLLSGETVPRCEEPCPFCAGTCFLRLGPAPQSHT